MVQPVVLECRLALGDIVMLTGVVRDLHLHHPCRFLTDVRTPFPDVWRHNAMVTRLPPSASRVRRIQCDELADPVGIETPIHCAQAVASGLAHALNLPLFPTSGGGDIPLSPAERRFPEIILQHTRARVPYWLIVAGGKQDCPVKWWDAARWQAVVDAFRDRILFVQVGAAVYEHPPLNGVLDLRGRTSVRQLIRLVHHAHGAVCPITSVMHLAAAVETPTGPASDRPCVVIAGGREAPHWAAYPGHQFVHTVGTLDCCRGNGCWRSRVSQVAESDQGASDFCLDVINGIPHCMDLISAKAVADRIQLFFDSGRLVELTPGQADIARKVTGQHQRRSWVPVSSPCRTARRLSSSQSRTGDAEVSILVLTYGDHARLIRRCLGSIHRHLDRSRFQLIVGANAPGFETSQFLSRQLLQGRIDRLHVSPINLHKCPMMRRLLSDTTTEFVWWMDDDVEVTDPGALDVRVVSACSADPRTVLWGDLHESHVGSSAETVEFGEWVAQATWFRGKSVGGNRGEFPIGAEWFARRRALKELDWPDRRLAITGEDVLLGEAIRQQGWRMQDLGGIGVRRWPEASRGPERAPLATDSALA